MILVADGFCGNMKLSQAVKIRASIQSRVSKILYNSGFQLVDQKCFPDNISLNIYPLKNYGTLHKSIKNNYWVDSCTILAFYKCCIYILQVFVMWDAACPSR